MALHSLELATAERGARPSRERPVEDRQDVPARSRAASGALTLEPDGADRPVPRRSGRGPRCSEAGFSFFTRSTWQPALGQFGVWSALLGTFLIAVIAPDHRGAGRDLLGAVRDRVRAGPAAAAAHLVHRRARRDPEPDLRALGPGVPPAAGDPAEPLAGHATSGSSRSSRRRTPQSVASYPASTFIAGHRRRADDRADLHRGDARGVLAGAARREGGRARARRHEVGRDQDGGAAVRPGRHHRRFDARARPRARRDDRGDA